MMDNKTYFEQWAKQQGLSTTKQVRGSKITVKHVKLMLDLLMDIDSVEYLFYGDALDEEDFMNQIKDNIEWLEEVRKKLMVKNEGS